MGKAKAGEYNGLGLLYRMRQAAELNPPPNDDAFAKAYPLLFSLLTSNAVDEGKYVDGVSLSIRNAAGDWKFTLGVPGLRMYRDILASTVQAGFEQLEQALGSKPADWKVDTRKSARIKEQKIKK